ncbi:hypothetical protein DYBT9623_05585 [Dyadobacter sp. CECT 9623]|uniref:Transposase n=1 Tax=Dyadobacter linearis TaxID=2823330 RepID=A0ABN7RIZ5_9BACT|nr:hypothetical protein DYBT9623_05585 [Dyadobacter sp. CECT 9623]
MGLVSHKPEPKKKIDTNSQECFKQVFAKIERYQKVPDFNLFPV